MKATVVQDTTQRTIELSVSGVPDIDVTQHRHKKARIFRPDSLVIRLSNGEISGATVRGGLVMKSGHASTEVREERQYGSWERHPIPPWVQRLMDEAPHGVTSWDEPEAQAL